jgi:hypothetical protein
LKFKLRSEVKVQAGCNGLNNNGMVMNLMLIALGEKVKNEPCIVITI